MNRNIDRILQELIERTEGIEGIVLVSSQGQPLTEIIGMEANSVLILSGTMLHLAERISEEFKWRVVDQISIRAEEGYVSLIRCHEEIFLLVKTAKYPLGFLDRNIDCTLKTIQTELQSIGTIEPITKELPAIGQLQQSDRITVLAKPASNIKLDDRFIARCQSLLAEYIGPIAAIVCRRTLSNNSQKSTSEFIEAIVKHIPDRQKAQEFKDRLFS